MHNTQIVLLFPCPADLEEPLGAVSDEDFEALILEQEKLQCCIELYSTWQAIYNASRLPEHYEAMQRAKLTVIKYKAA